MNASCKYVRAAMVLVVGAAAACATPYFGDDPGEASASPTRRPPSDSTGPNPDDATPAPPEPEPGADASTGRPSDGDAATLPSAVKRVFVTSGAWSGDLGGVAGADAKCQSEAAAAGLDGVYGAWLGGPVTDPVDGLATGRPYVRIDGAQVFEDRLAIAERSSPPINGITLTASGGGVPGNPRELWTGAGINGRSTGYHCNAWTSDSATVAAHVGIIGATTTDWTISTLRSCNAVAHLLCFESR
jgi:hypothetical protein